MPRKPSTSARTRSRAKSRPRKRRPAPQQTRQTELALASFAHEIRTSLTGILALGELLATSGLGEREARWAAGVKNTAEHLASLVNLTIDSAKAGAKGLMLRREPFRLRRLVDSIAASLAARAETKGLHVETAIAKDLPESVIGDAVRLRAALENLIDNAVKFTDSGKIRLTVTATPLSRGRIRLDFAVADSGIGLKPSEIKRLFRPFAQANDAIVRRYGGAGLGLVFVKRVAKAMGGDLTVSGMPGGGSTFRLTAVVEKTTASLAPAPGIDGRRRSGASARALKILCAEDNPFGRVVLNTILTELGHHADFVGTAETAVEAVRRNTYDLVLMDVMLAGTDGVEATRRIRALPPPHGRVPIIGISGRTTSGDEMKGHAAGMNGYLTKPISPRMLASAIAAAVPK
ncbi:MAG: ATP-binding protein [Xanthobacteraceae bacterium]